MKTIFTTLTLCLCGLFVQAQDLAILQEIEQANAKIKSLESQFVQEDNSLAKGESKQSQGTLYLNGANQMAMHYAKPSTDLLVINGKDFYLKRGKRQKLYNTEKNNSMLRLSNTLLLCLHGKPQQLAKESAAALTTAKTSKGYVVTLTTTVKQSRGYSKIVLTYDLKTKLLATMQMDEFNGNSTTYSMSGIKTNASIDTAVFAIPKN